MTEQPPRKRLLIIVHSRSGTNQALGRAIAEGAQDAHIEIRLKAPEEANENDLFWMDGVIFVSPERFRLDFRATQGPFRANVLPHREPTPRACNGHRDWYWN